MTAVTEAVAFIEALINEFFVDIRDSHANRYDALGEETPKRIREYWDVAGSGNNVPILTKYEMARSLCGRGTYDQGRDPYQSMKAVIDLRNWQMHYRPKNLGEGTTISSGKVYEAECSPGSSTQPATLAARLTGWWPPEALSAPISWANSWTLPTSIRQQRRDHPALRVPVTDRRTCPSSVTPAQDHAQQLEHRRSPTRSSTACINASTGIASKQLAISVSITHRRPRQDSSIRTPTRTAARLIGAAPA